jgi:hypothetical protein
MISRIKISWVQVVIETQAHSPFRSNGFTNLVASIVTCRVAISITKPRHLDEEYSGVITNLGVNCSVTIPDDFPDKDIVQVVIETQAHSPFRSNGFTNLVASIVTCRVAIHLDEEYSGVITNLGVNCSVTIPDDFPDKDKLDIFHSNL